MKKFFASLINLIICLIEAIDLKKDSIQETLNTVDFSSPEDVKGKLSDHDVQSALAAWVNSNLRSLENNDNYLKVAQGNTLDQLFQIDTATIQKVLDVMMPYVLLGTPAHDLGHHTFDALGGSAIIGNDPFIAKCYRNEINAAFFGAMFHDSSTGVQHRYIDNEWELNHGELAACIFFFNTKWLLPRNLRLLTAYAIAAHPHMLKEMTAKNGTVRKPWNDELFYDGEKPVRFAVWLTRWSDRLENGADPACHFPRQLLAALDAACVNGLDLSGVDWFSFKDQLAYLFTPEAKIFEFPILDKDGQPVLDKNGVPTIGKIPTTLQALQSYRLSADPAAKPSPYNQHDDKSSSMRRLMDWKITKSIQFVNAVTNTTGAPEFEKLVTLMTLKSGDPLSATGCVTIDMVRELWDHFSPEDQSHWAKGFDLALDSYYEWLHILKTEINHATDPTIKAFAPLVPTLIEKVM